MIFSALTHIGVKLLAVKLILHVPWMHQYASVLVTSAQIELVQIFPLWSWVKSNQHSEKSTLIHKTQPRCFHCGCSVFCVSVHFISSPRPSCQSIPSGTAGTPPLWTKTRAPWPSWRAAPGDLWTACPCCSSGSMWNAKSKSWPHLNMWKVARSNRKYTVNRRKTIKQSINLRWIILSWNSTQINRQYG